MPVMCVMGGTCVKSCCAPVKLHEKCVFHQTTGHNQLFNSNSRALERFQDDARTNAQ